MRAHFTKTSKRTFNLHTDGAAAAAKFTLSSEGGTWLTYSGNGELEPECPYNAKLPAALDYYTQKLVYCTLTAGAYADAIDRHAPELQPVADFLRLWEQEYYARSTKSAPVPHSEER